MLRNILHIYHIRYFYIDDDFYHNDESGYGTAFIFATNYNILRIMSGMGGLAFSN